MSLLFTDRAPSEDAAGEGDRDATAAAAAGDREPE